MQRESTSSNVFWPYTALTLCLLALAGLSLRVWHSPGRATPPLSGPVRPAIGPERTTAGPERPDGSPASARVGLFDLVDLSAFPAPPGRAETRPPVADGHIELGASHDLDELTLVEQRPLTIDRPSLDNRDVSESVDVEPWDANSERVHGFEAMPAIVEDPVALPRSAAETAASIATVWPIPRAIAQKLNQILAERPSEALRDWVVSVQLQLDHLTNSDSLDSPQAKEAIQELGRLHDSVGKLTATLPPDQQPNMLRLAHALNRRVLVWKQLQRVAAKPVFTSFSPDHGVHLRQHLAAVEQHLLGVRDAEPWRRYLLLSELKSTAQTSPVGLDRQFTALARRVLARMTSDSLSDEQSAFLNAPVFADLRLDLQRCATEPIDYRTLLDDLELVELFGDSASAAGVANAYQVLRWSPDEDVAALSHGIESQYRNGNLRLAISRHLLDRMLPDPSAHDEPVEDDFMGARIRGKSRAISQLRIVLIPDHRQWRVDLEAVGNVSSETSAEKGPAQLFTQGFSNYYARKPLFVDRRGIRVRGTESSATTQADLSGVATTLDGLPIFGPLARAIAINQHQQNLPSARSMTDEKIASRARQVMDEEVERQMRKAELEFEKKLLAPLRKLQLQPTAIDMQTTTERLIVRYRLAGDRQLAGYTPRPQAPADSYLSTQIHQTAINNTFDNLNFAGRRADLREFVTEMSKKCTPDVFPVSLDDIPENITIQFAQQDPFRLYLNDGRATFVLRFAEIESAEGRKWRDFAVHIPYKPDPLQRQANLVRDGIIEIPGSRLSGTQRLTLRMIFTKLFPKSRSINLISQQIEKNPKLHDLTVSQFVITDGWIGLALAPERRTAAREDADTRHRRRR